MGKDLMGFAIFRGALEEANETFKDLGADWDLFAVLEDSSRIDRPECNQPICTALQIALVEVLKSFDINPRATVGHSSGEIAAAYAIGALSLHAACKVAFHRGRLAGRMTGPNAGAMLSVDLSEDVLKNHVESLGLTRKVHIACVNSPTNVTVSGDEAGIEALKKLCETEKIFAAKLRTGVAYHSPVMREIAEEYLTCLDSLEPGTGPQIPTTMI